MDEKFEDIIKVVKEYLKKFEYLYLIYIILLYIW